MSNFFQQSTGLKSSLGQLNQQCIDIVKELNRSYPNGFSMYIPTITLDIYTKSCHPFADTDGKVFFLVGLSVHPLSILVAYEGQTNKCVDLHCNVIQVADLIEIVNQLSQFITPKELEENGY
jgi:hypothetical protein